MSTNDLNVPGPRLPEQATEPAATAAQSAAAYPVPLNLTPGGLLAFRAEVAQFAIGLGAELEKKEVETLSRGGQPEHTAEAVAKARHDYLRRFRSEHAVSEQRAQRGRAVLAVILLTVATVGLNVMQNFLHSEWQFVVFGVFVLVGLSGLGLTWAGRLVSGVADHA